MAKVASIDRTTTNISTLVHENYVNDVLPWLSHVSPLSGVFGKVGDKGYTIVGKKLVIAADNSYRGGYMGTDGYIPEPQSVDPINLEFTAARCYVSGAVDNFLKELAVTPGAFENFSDRLMDQMWDAVERGTTFQIHAGSASTLCVVTSRTSATELVVEDAYGYDGAKGPTMFIEPGMFIACLDASSAFAVLGAAVVSAVAHRTTATTATVTFSDAIEDTGTIAAGDLLVRCTTGTTTDAHFVTERARGPLGLLDIVDPADSASTYAGLTEATTARILPVRRVSSDFGQTELMEFGAEISASSGSPFTSDSHVVTMQKGAEIELAKELLQYQQQSQLGMELHGGWKSVKIGDFNILSDPYHIHNVAYFLCPEDLFVIDLGGKPDLYSGDGSMFQRMLDYDGEQWFAKWYGQRGARRRNRLGALTGISNPNGERFAAVPV